MKQKNLQNDMYK